MKRIVVLACLLLSTSVFAGAEVQSCGVDLSTDMFQQSPTEADQTRQVLQQFDAKDCYVALDECDDARRQMQRQNSEQKGHLECKVRAIVRINARSSLSHNTCGTCRRRREYPKPRFPRPTPKLPRSSCANQSDDQDSKPTICCPSKRTCGKNPMLDSRGANLNVLFKYRRCIAKLQECREGKVEEPKDDELYSAQDY